LSRPPGHRASLGGLTLQMWQCGAFAKIVAHLSATREKNPGGPYFAKAKAGSGNLFSCSMFSSQAASDPAPDHCASLGGTFNFQAPPSHHSRRKGGGGHSEHTLGKSCVMDGGGADQFSWARRGYPRAIRVIRGPFPETG